MDTTSVNNAISFSPSVGSISHSWNANERIVTFTTSGFQFGTQYTMTIQPTAKDKYSHPLDGDGNGWIDENDGQFAALRTWNPLADPGRQGLSLAEAGVGALSLSRATTPFDLYGSDAAQLGTLRATGIALRETGEAGTISHIDLTA